MAGFADLLTIDPGQILREQDRLKGAVFAAGTAAIREGTRDLERDLEALLRRVAGGRLWRAISSNAYPARGAAESPAGIVYLKGRRRTHGAIEYFTTSGRIASASGPVAVPLPAAGGRGYRRGREWIDNTPEEWERRNGVKLELVKRRGKLPLLVAKVGTTNARGRFRAITRRRTKTDERRGYMRGEQTVPIFVLIPIQSFTARASMEPTVRAALSKLPGRVSRRISEIS